MKKYNIVFGLLLCGMTFLSSCQDWDFDTDSSYEKLFRTPKLEVEELDATYANLIWNKVPNADYYLLELSKDSLAFTTDLKVLGGDKSIIEGEYKVTGLLGGVRYSVRVKALSDKGIKESEYATLTFKTKTEQILNEVTGVTGKSAVISWEAGLQVNKVVISGNGNSVERALTAEEVAAGKVTLTDLVASTDYQVTIWLDDTQRGKRSFSTTENYPDGYTVMNLTATDNVNEVLLAAEGDVVLVIPYSVDLEFTETVTIPESVTSIIFWGASGGPAKANLKVKSFIANGTKEQVKFYNLNIDPQAGYLFNQQEMDATIGAVIVDGCTIEKNSGVIRAKGDANNISIGKAIINNSVIKDCTKALFAFKEAKNAQIPVIELTNSTVMNVAQQYFYLIQPATIKVDYCTLYGINVSKAFMELSDKTINCPLSVKNTIIAKSSDPTKIIKACNVKNMVSTENTIVASDCVFDSSYPMEGSQPYAKTAEDLFENAVNGDFRIKDPAFTLVIGDPRWNE